jgi:uncharacterized protein (DUF2267 family)
VKYDEFIAQVQRRADLSTHDEADRAVRATLETLAERLAGGEAKDLAAQLPSEIAVYLEQPLAGAGQSYSLDEFFQRVSDREGIALPDATFHARVVCGLVSEVVTVGEIENVRAQLPAEFRELFAVENEGELPGQGVIDTSLEVEEEDLAADQRPAPQRTQPPLVSDMGVDVDHPVPPSKLFTEG